MHKKTYYYPRRYLHQYRSSAYKKNQVSEEILRDVRQEGPISTKLFAATIHEIFKNAQFEVKRMTANGRKTVVPEI